MNSEKQKTPQETKSNKWSLLERYAKGERARVERLKADAISGTKESPSGRETPYMVRERYEQEQITARPSTIRKIGRSALDLVSLSIPAIEARRDREAMSVAVRELQAEDDEKFVQGQLGIAQRDLGNAVRDILHQDEVQERERKNLERDMANAREALDYRKKERFKGDRAQELVEREISQKLLKIDSLEEEVLAENPEINLSSVEFEGEDIPVYNLKGYPFSLLTHAIDYRHANNNNQNHIGVQTMNELLENPAIWTQTEDEAKLGAGYGTRNGDARGNVISTSYTNSESNIATRVGNFHDHTHTVYGFSKLEGDSIISIHQGDGGTSNMGGHQRTAIKEYDVDSIAHLEGASTRSGYNEILLRRYDETGKPRRPDYIVAENGKITEAAKRHAKFFNIPIINIERQAYNEKNERAALEALDDITPDSSYEEVIKNIDTAKKIDRFNHEIWSIDRVGDGSEHDFIAVRRRDIAAAPNDKIRAERERIADVAELELKKRLEFIEQEIERCISEVQKANHEGREYEYRSDVLERFDTHVYDVTTDRQFPSFDEGGMRMNLNGVGSMSHVDINMRFKGGTRSIETRCQDGEHRHQAEQYYALYPNERELQYDSSAYKKLAPRLMKYYQLMRENEQLSRKAQVRKVPTRRRIGAS